MGVNLGYDCLGAGGGGGGQVGGDTETYIAVRVGTRAVEQHHVDGPASFMHQAGHLPEEAGGGGAVSFVNPAADIVGHEAGVDKERVLVFGFAVGGFPVGHGKTAVEDHTPQFMAAARHCVHQCLGNRGGTLNINMIAALYEFYGFVGGAEWHNGVTVGFGFTLRDGRGGTGSDAGRAARKIREC